MFGGFPPAFWAVTRTSVSVSPPIPCCGSQCCPQALLPRCFPRGQDRDCPPHSLLTGNNPEQQTARLHQSMGTSSSLLMLNSRHAYSLLPTLYSSQPLGRVSISCLTGQDNHHTVLFTPASLSFYFWEE